MAHMVLPSPQFWNPPVSSELGATLRNSEGIVCNHSCHRVEENGLREEGKEKVVREGSLRMFPGSISKQLILGRPDQVDPLHAPTPSLPLEKLIFS